MKNGETATGDARHPHTVKPATLLKALGFGVAAVVCVLFVVLLLLLLPPVRSRVLTEIILQADARLPGAVTVEDAAWPSPGTLRLAGLAWVDSPDTLLSADRLEISVEIRPLFRRDLRATELVLEGASADLPAIRERFPARDSTESAPGETSSGRGFPREGSIPGIPSVAVDRLGLTVRHARLTESLSVRDLTLSARADLCSGHDPVMDVDRFSVRGPGDGWRVEDLTLEADLAAGRASGKGSGQLAPEWPLFFSIETGGDDQVRLLLTRRQGIHPPDAVGLTLVARITRDERRISSFEFDAFLRTPGTEDLKDFVPLASRLEGVPVLEGIGLSGHGRVGLVPERSADLGLSLHPNSWLRGGETAVRYSPRALEVDTLWVALPGLVAGAHARFGPDSLIAEARAGIDGTGWLAILRPGAQGPDSLKADLVVGVRGPRRAPDVRAALEASADFGGFRLDRLLATARMPGEKERPGELVLEAKALDTTMRAAAELDRTEGLSLRISPLVISEKAGPVPRGIDTYPKSGWLRYSGEEGLRISKLEVTGALGELRADLDLSRVQPGSFSLEGNWPELPTPLLHALRLEPPERDSLGAAWRRSGPFLISVRGIVESGEDVRRISSDGRFRLPGPRTLAVLLPPRVRVDDLTALQGRLSLEVDQGQESPGFVIGLDMGETAWLDTAEVAVRGRGSRLDMDRLALAFEGLSAGLDGSRVDSLWDLRARIDLADARLLRRLAPDLGDSLDLKLHARAGFRGTPAAPDLSAELEASIQGPSFALPGLEGQVRWKRAALEADLNAPSGALFGQVRLDTLHATYRTPADGRPFSTGRVTLNAQGPEIGLFHDLRIQTKDGLQIRGENLTLRLREQRLGISRPFELQILPGGAGVRVSHFNLAGSLGSIRAEGIAGPDSSRIVATAALELPDQPLLPSIPSDLWPGQVDLEVRGQGREEIRASAKISGLTLGNREEISSRIEMEGNHRGVILDVSMLDKEGPILDARAELPLHVSLYPPGARLGDGAVSVETALSRFPVPTELDGIRLLPISRRTAQLAGSVSVRGTARRPSAHADARLSFPGWPKMSRYVFRVEALALPDSGNGTAFPRAGEKGSLLEKEAARPGGAGGVAAAFSFDRLDRPVLWGSAVYPLVWSLLPGESPAVRGESGSLRVVSEDLPLSEFDPLLPPDVGLDGNLRVRFAASGNPGDPEMDGELVLSRVRVSRADGTRILSNGTVSVSGTAKKPSIRGDLEIANGVIRVPDPPKNLHPVHGTALLWEEEAGPPVSAAEDETRPPAPAKPQPARPPDVDLDVTIVIPSGLWIRGQGLDVELAGDLQVVQRGRQPTVTGSLNAVRGHLDFLGRVFVVDRGQVVFYGDDEADPSLDLRLSSRVEAHLIHVSVGGTVRKPELALTSEPEMPEGDIMSILLFGRPLDELTTDQANLVQRRAADIATAFGMAQLEMRIARQLGVDMVSIQTGSGQDSRRSLIVGKYVSRRVLLKYEQALEEWGSFFFNLEYFLTRHFKVETLIGRQSESALEINWSTEY